MLRTGVGDQADARARDLHQLFDVTATIRPHLDHRAHVAVVQAQQRHRHTQVIVQIAAGGQARPALRQDGGDHLLDRGLAVAAGDTDQRPLELRARFARRGGQGRLDVRHHDLRQRQRQATRHDGTGGTGAGRGGHEIMSVGVLTAQRGEQVAGGQLAAVDGDLVEGAILAVQAPVTGGGELLQGADHVVARSPSTLRTTAASLKARRSWPTIWYSS